MLKPARHEKASVQIGLVDRKMISQDSAAVKSLNLTENPAITAGAIIMRGTRPMLFGN